MSFMAVAAGAQAIGGLMGAAEESRSLKQSARIDEENSRRTLLSGEEQVFQTIRDERMVSGEAIAAGGSSGFELGTGSAADIIRQNGIERETEILNIRYQARGEADDLIRSAREKRRAAKGAIVKGIFGAVATGAKFASDRDTQKKVSERAERERQSKIPTKRKSKFGVLSLPGA